MFRRSSVFGIVGVIVTAVLVAVVGLTMGQDDANPRDALGLIFGIVAVYLVLLFTLQLRDVSRAEAGGEDARLWLEMAVRPVDEDAIQARKEIWGTTRANINTAMLVSGLIFLSVPPIYLFETFVPLLVGAPLIAGVALWKSAGLLRAGGGLDRAYDSASRAMAPLGLTIVERPEVTIAARGAAPFRMGPKLHGALVMEGRRHDRAVTVAMPTSEGVRAPSAVHVAAAATASYEFRARDGRLKATEGAPEAVREALAAIPSSPRWNGVRGRADASGITVERKSSGGADWLLDLWLSERLAVAAGG